MVSGPSHTNLPQDLEHSKDDLVDGGFDATLDTPLEKQNCSAKFTSAIGNQGSNVVAD